MLIKPRVLKDLDSDARERLLKRCMDKVDEVMNDVASIVEDVRENGDLAVLKYTKKFDSAELSRSQLTVTKSEIEGAYRRKLSNGDAKSIESLKCLNENLIRSHEEQVKRYAPLTTLMGIRSNTPWEVGRVFRPVGKVGVYAPNGTTPYPTTVLMATAPAKVAGVKEVVVATKPNIDGTINDWILIACDIAGVDKIFKVGGAQAIGALGCGTETIPQVTKVVGPGNIFVTAAKMYAQAKGYCDIDFPAGPSEILIIADGTADPKCITWDMFSQAEHDKNACAILVTTSAQLADRVAITLEKELEECAVKRDIKEAALKNYGSILIVDSIDEAIAFSNEFAPEHLAIMINDDSQILDKIMNAGTVCLGMYSPVAASDYFSGTNHILPTGGWAKMSSGLSVSTFMKSTTFQKISPEALQFMQPHIANLSLAENLFDAHGKSIAKRFLEGAKIG